VKGWNKLVSPSITLAHDVVIEAQLDFKGAFPRLAHALQQYF
jgi:hypothetical protein